MTLAGALSRATMECQSGGVEIFALPHYKQMSLEIFNTSIDIAKYHDIVHGHGLWLPLNWATGKAAIINNKPLVITPRGSLNPNALKHSRFKKKIIGGLFDNRYLRAAKCIHVTSHDEYMAVRGYGLVNPVAIIPNGVRSEIIQNAMPEQTFRKKFGISHESKILLFLSRISWEKGLEDLADAWGQVSGTFTDWQLVIVGPGKPDYVARLQDRFSSKPGGNRVLWLGPLEGAEKFGAYSAASIFVLPSHTENFSIVIAEALVAGVPVVTTQGTPWSEISKYNCGWWVPVGAKSIASALLEAMALPDDKRREMGARGKSLIGEKYTWPVIARQMLEVYEWLLGNHEAPPCIVMD